MTTALGQIVEVIKYVTIDGRHVEPAPQGGLQLAPQWAHLYPPAGRVVQGAVQQQQQPTAMHSWSHYPATSYGATYR